MKRSFNNHYIKFIRLLHVAFFAALTILATSGGALAENYAFQFECIENGYHVTTPWMDERLSTAVSFSKGREGDRYYWAARDCGDYGPWACVDNPTLPEWAWVEHRTRLSCDAVCINIRDIDGALYHTPSPVEIRRLPVSFSDGYDYIRITGEPNNTWNYPPRDVYDPDIDVEPHARSDRGGNDGVTYCVDEAWPEDFWVTLDNERGGGVVTEIQFTDHEGVEHTFRAVPAYPISSDW